MPLILFRQSPSEEEVCCVGGLTDVGPDCRGLPKELLQLGLTFPGVREIQGKAFSSAGTAHHTEKLKWA